MTNPKLRNNHLVVPSTAQNSFYSFNEIVNCGPALFVSDGNFSFSLSTAKNNHAFAHNLVATTPYSIIELPISTQMNIASLKFLGAQCFERIWVENLSRDFVGREFNHVIFQFPNAGKRLSDSGNTANFDLLVNFLFNAQKILSTNGKILVTLVDSPYYDGQFDIERAALLTHYSILGRMPFHSDQFPGYTHENTTDEASAISKYNGFITWEFVPNFQ